MYGPVNESISIGIFKQVVDIVAYLHHMGLCHNEIQGKNIDHTNHTQILAENVMINVKTHQVKLIGFGALTELKRGVYEKYSVVTSKFSSPESLKGSYFLEFNEIWTLGYLFYLLLFKMDPFENNDEILQLDLSKRIEHIRLYGANGQHVHISDASVRAILKMMDKKWSKRPRAHQIHKLFK
jgi:serine/threonine protein kinase